jgi:hypothetical protein
MKNLTAQWAARADAMKDGGLTRDSIWAALNGDTTRLARRLRNRKASTEEIEFAADLIEGKVNPRRPRLGQPSLMKNEEMAGAYFVLRAMHPNWQEKQIIGKIVGMFGLKGEYGRHIYDVLKALDPERRRFYEKISARVAKAFARKPDLEKAWNDRRLNVYFIEETGKLKFLEFLARE